MCLACGCQPLARSAVYESLSVGFLYPEPAGLTFLASRLPEVRACLRRLGDKESTRWLGALMKAAGALSSATWEGQYGQVFGLTISKECPPYETEYGQAHIFQKAQTLADLAGFYRAFGVQLASSFKDRLDHVSVELEFMHLLALKEAHATRAGHSQERVALCREAQGKFLDAHLGAWIFTFAQKCQDRAGAGVYGIWGALTQSFVAADMARLGLKPHPELAAVPPEALRGQAAGDFACPLVDQLGGGTE